MYIKILDYLIDRLINLRDRLRHPNISSKEWLEQYKKWKNKTYK
jgi:hypothetical protein